MEEFDKCQFALRGVLSRQICTSRLQARRIRIDLVSEFLNVQICHSLLGQRKQDEWCPSLRKYALFTRPLQLLAGVLYHIA